jgi:hypothetical protein
MAACSAPRWRNHGEGWRTDGHRKTTAVLAYNGHGALWRQAPAYGVAALHKRYIA